MLWHIRHACPQCGAPVDLSESDRLLACPFCRVRLYLCTSGVFRYVLPPQDKDRDDLLFVPYWRFKGSMFSCIPMKVRHRLLDSTILARREKRFSLSLGIRPQALSLRFAHACEQGDFILPELRLSEAVAMMIRRIRSLDNTWGKKAFCRDFIGEQASIIYAPVYEQNGKLYDAVLNRPLRVLQDLPREWKTQKPGGWEVKYLPTLCPGCGWDLHGDQDSLVLACSNCDSAWHETGGKLHRLQVRCDCSSEQGLMLPFWKFSVQSDDLSLYSAADLIRLGNLPRVPRPGEQDQPCAFLVPAFKLRPDLFLRLARQMTTCIPQEEGDTTVPDSYFPATLSMGEGFQSLKYVIGDMAAAKKNIFPILREAELKLLDTSLLFLPFEHRAGEVKHPISAISISKPALEHSRHM